MTEDLREQLAELVQDGGSFMITRNRTNVRTWFTLGLTGRVPLLNRIVRETGIGRAGNLKKGAVCYPRWEVASHKDLVALAELLDTFEFSGQRAAEFAIWRKAVAFRDTLMLHGPVDWAPMYELREQLIQVRRDWRGWRIGEVVDPCVDLRITEADVLTAKVIREHEARPPKPQAHPCVKFSLTGGYRAVSFSQAFPVYSFA